MRERKFAQVRRQARLEALSMFVFNYRMGKYSLVKIVRLGLLCSLAAGAGIWWLERRGDPLDVLGGTRLTDVEMRRWGESVALYGSLEEVLLIKQSRSDVLEQIRSLSAVSAQHPLRGYDLANDMPEFVLPNGKHVILADSKSLKRHEIVIGPNATVVFVARKENLWDHFVDQVAGVTGGR